MRRFGLALAVVFSITATAAAQDHFFWTIPGSTGVTDDEGTWAVALFDTGSAAIRSSVPSATIKLRYAVTGGPERLDGAFDPSFCLRLSVRDTGASARVLARLLALDATTGAQSVLGSYDSDADARLAPGVNYQNAVTCGLASPSGGSMTGFDYLHYAYYVEVTLTKTDSSGNPGLRVVGITGG